MNKQNILTALFGAFITLLALAPVGYQFYANLPQKIATVDLQKLVEDEQKRVIEILGDGSNITPEMRRKVEMLTGDFAKRLSDTIDAMGAECQCVIVNKAALLGGTTIDFTELVRERIKQ